jgi:hypothetical protein
LKLFNLGNRKLAVILFLLFFAFLISRTWFLSATLDDFAQLRNIQFFNRFTRPDATLSNNVFLRPEYSRILFPYIIRGLSLIRESPLITFEALRFILVFTMLLSQYHFASRFLNPRSGLLSAMLLAVLLLVTYRPGSPRGDAMNDLLDVICVCLMGILALRPEFGWKEGCLAFVLQIGMALNRGEASLLLPLIFLILIISKTGWVRRAVFLNGLIAAVLFIAGFLSIAFARQMNLGTYASANLQTQLNVIEGYSVYYRTVYDMQHVGQELYLLFKGMFAPWRLPEGADPIRISRDFGIYNIWFSFFWVFIPTLFIPTLFIRRLKRTGRYLIALTWILLFISWFGTQMDEVRAVSFLFPLCAIIPFWAWEELKQCEGGYK